MTGSVNHSIVLWLNGRHPPLRPRALIQAVLWCQANANNSQCAWKKLGLECAGFLLPVSEIQPRTTNLARGTTHAPPVQTKTHLPKSTLLQLFVTKMYIRQRMQGTSGNWTCGGFTDWPTHLHLRLLSMLRISDPFGSDHQGLAIYANSLGHGLGV